MRNIYILFSLLWLYQTLSLLGETYTPEIYEEQRYQHIWSRKPFHPPTLIAATPSTEEQQYTLSGLLRMGDRWIAFVQDRKSLQRHSVSSVPNEIGLQLIPFS